MRLGRSASGEERRKDKKFGRKKHKRLDAICEQAYSRSHIGVAREKLSEVNVGEDNAELRRSGRVRKAPVLLDTSPPPARKRRKIERRSGVSSVDRVQGEGRVKKGLDCSVSGDLKEGSSGWGSRLRTRAKGVGFNVKEKGIWSPRGKRKLFNEYEKVKEESLSESGEFDEKREDVVIDKLIVAKSQRPGRTEGSDVSGSEHQDAESLSEAEEFDEMREDVVIDKSIVAKSQRPGRTESSNVSGSESQNGESLSESGDFDEMREDADMDKSIVAKSLRPGRPEGSNVSGSEYQGVELEGPGKDEKKSSEKEVSQVRDEGVILLLQRDMEQRDDKKVNNDDEPLQLVDMGRSKVEAGKQSEDSQEDRLVTIEEDMQAEEHVCAVGADRPNPVEVEVSAANTDKDAENADIPLKNGTFEKSRKKDYTSDGPLGKLRIKEGRHCALCGTGNAGKPPKKMAQDGAGSDSETCSGSSASEEPNYDIWDGFGDEHGWLGRLLGPINDRFGIAGIFVHQQCAVWSPEVYFAGLGCLKNVRTALCRGRALKCSRCVRPGATIGCRVDRCPKTYHLPCARANGCIFDHRKFLIACTDHRHLFQPQGTQYFDRLKKLKAKKMKLEMRKASNDAWRKDVEEEEKWLENCGEDEEFLKRESKRLHRDLLRIAPTYIGGSSCKQEMQFEGWDSVAGLQNVIQCMKEVVILPLLYPEFFNNLGITPPRGVLLHGYPGTGKTLVVRALIGSCARGDKRIAYFARKGADCLGKYVGDAERQLRLLFQVAEKTQPSIIFFDEIDGLAPSRTPQQDQTHSSVVSTLLALMDGLKSRGSVVVIGATNRPDAVDPALRRPGRFDREIYFPLPSVKDREAILSLHTQKWPKPITGPLLKCIARKTVGYAGADLQALCTQAAVISLRRRFPLHALLSAAAERTTGQRPRLPTVTVEERDWLEALYCAPPPCSQREAGMAANDLVSSPLHNYLVSCLLQPVSRLLISLYLDERVWLPPHLYKAATLIENVILSALDEKKLKRDKWWSHAHDLLEETNIKCEIEDRLRSAGIVIGDICFDSTCTVEDDTNDKHLNLGTSRVLCSRPGLLQSSNYASRQKLGFRILISGNPRSGQRHLASCLLHYFVGNVDVQKVDMATISQEGHGDMVQGLTQILMRCASLPSCVMFMPRIDLWAIDISDQEFDLESRSCPTHTELQSSDCSKRIEIDKEHKLCPNAALGDTALPQSIVTKASYLWSTFIEQVDSVCVNTSLMILATSEVQFSELPSRIRQFFRAEIQRVNISTPVGDSVPKFLVEVDGKFDCDMVFDSCAVNLSKDLAQHFVRMLYYRNHIHVNSFENEQLCDGVPDNGVAARLQSDLSSVTPSEGKPCPIIPVSSTVLGNVSVKGKSGLQLAITAFGYQILLYPHFAELCWVTSKLKEGPSANISGPWKGWPFNSCIAHPINSVEKVAAVSGGGFIKIKEKSSIVRGLIAVGLSAYRAEYRSLRAVVSEVRKVLELLVERINSKIEAGKDRYCYGRLMSQVAYLEDIVLSWAHALQRLEVDTRPDSEPPCKASLDYGSAWKNCPLEGDESKKDAPSQILQASSVLEKAPEDQTANTIGRIGQKEDADIGQQNTFSEITVEEENAQLLVSDSMRPLTHFQNSVPDGIDFQHVSDPPENGKEVGKDSVPNGFVETKSVTDDAPCGSGDHCSTQFGICQLEDGSLADNLSSELVTEDTNRDNVNGNHFSGSTRGSPRSGIMCSYHICSDCVVKLHQLVKEILNRYWGLKGNHPAVEEVHDIVSSLSSKLHAAVRRLSMTENTGNSCEKNPMQASDTISCQEMGVSPRNGLGRLPNECHCPSSSNNVDKEREANRSGLDLKFIFRDGVLTSLDTDDDLSFHCDFKTLCLCSLIEILVMSKENLQ